MGRPLRTDIGDMVYHVLNRANNRNQIFCKNNDYFAFEKILEETKNKIAMRILSYTIMPNHWHFVLCPHNDGDLGKFMRCLTLTHTQRWHAYNQNIGEGHLYQGRYKSFLVQEDGHFLQLVRYVERNPVRAKLVDFAQDWRWGSVWRRMKGTEKQKELLSDWPVPPASDYLEWVNEKQREDELDDIRFHLKRGRPYGGEEWAHSFI